MPSRTVIVNPCRELSVLSGRVERRYECRVCQKKESHPLRKCVKFLAYSTEDRIRAVALYKYCPNCLAHDHYGRGCTSESRCHVCRGDHHTYLHEHEESRSSTTVPHRERSVTSKSQPRGARVKSVTSKSQPRGARVKSGTSKSQPRETRARSVTFQPSESRRLFSRVQTKQAGRSYPPLLSVLMTSKSISLVPTANVTIVAEDHRSLARCVIDQCRPVSRISRALVEKLKIGTLEFSGEKVCMIGVQVRYPKRSILQVPVKVSSASEIKVPGRDIDPNLSESFVALDLADRQFHKSRTIDIVFGADLYSKILLDGVIRKPGLPLAQLTIFGWVLSGTSPQ